jgi:NAD+ kinase
MDSGLSRQPPRRLGVVVKTSNPDAVALGLKVLAELAARGVTGVVDSESAPVLGAPSGPPRALLGREVDAVIVLGGDGTFLSVTRGCPTAVPVAGVNLGTLGFLTEHAPEQTFQLLGAILAGRVEIERRERLLVEVVGGNGERAYQVLNDVVITKAALARIVTIAVDIDGEFLTRYRGDGLIMATPTGSTAYNLSAGGPIVHPGLSSLLITPICSHTLTDRPLAVPLTSRVRAYLEPGEAEVYLTLDGQRGFPFTPGMSVSVSRSAEPLSLIREPSSSFFSILHQKLKWGERES